MKILDQRTAGDLVKLRHLHRGDHAGDRRAGGHHRQPHLRRDQDYKAEFADATGVVKGDDIRVAGVKVGMVKERRDRRPDPGDGHVRRRGRDIADQGHPRRDPLPQPGRPALHLADPGGRRHAPGSPRARRSRSPQTSPALDLTVLFNGFKPLFAALTPTDVNKLSYEIVQVFQGEGGTLEGLLAHTALGDLDPRRPRPADRRTDRQPRRRCSTTVGDRDDQLSELIVRSAKFVGGLKTDRQAILGSLDSISDLAVRDRRPRHRHPQPFVGDITQLRTVAGNIDKNKAEIDRALQVLPIKLDQGRPHRDLRLVVQLLPLRVPGERVPALPGAGPDRSRYKTGSDRCD